MPSVVERIAAIDRTLREQREIALRLQAIAEGDNAIHVAWILEQTEAIEGEFAELVGTVSLGDA